MFYVAMLFSIIACLLPLSRPPMSALSHIHVCPNLFYSLSAQEPPTPSVYAAIVISPCSVVRSPNASPKNEYPIPVPHVMSCTELPYQQPKPIYISGFRGPSPSQPSQTQPIQTQSIPTPHPPHHPQLEKLLLPRRRPTPDIQLLRPQRIPEPLATTIAPPPSTATPLLLGDGHRPVVMRPRRVQRQLADDAGA